MEPGWVSKAMMVNLLAFRLFSFNFQCNSHLFFSSLGSLICSFQTITLCFCKNWGLQPAIFCLHKVHPFTLVHWQCVPLCQPRSLLYPTPCFRAPILMSLSKLVTNTLKHAQAPPVCQTHFPSDPSRGEARVEVADTLLMPSAHYCVSECVCVHWCHPHGWPHICGHGRFHSKVCLGEGKVAHCTFANFKIMNSHVCSVIWKTV